MRECQQIVTWHVYSNWRHSGFICPLLGQCIAYLNILNTAVSCILNIAALHCHVSRITFQYAWIIGICISTQRVTLRTPEVPMFLKSGSLPFVHSIGSPEIGAAQHIIALGHSLQKYAEIDTFPCCIQRDTIFKSRCIIAQNHTVTGFLCGIFTCRDHSIAVYILIHDITCSPLASQRRLIHFGQVSVHLFLWLCDTYRFISPDFSFHHSRIICFGKFVVFIRIASDFLLVIG